MSDSSLNRQKIRKVLILGLMTLGSISSLFAWEEATIHAYVFDDFLEMPIYNANIEIPSEKIGTTTDSLGYCELTLDKSYPIFITVSHIAYFPQTIRIMDEDVVNINLKPRSIMTQAVEVKGDIHLENRDISAPKTTINASQLELKVVQDFEEIARTTSSVSISSATDGSKTISIRGSNPNEIPVFVDGIRINDSFSNIADLSTINLQDISAMNIIKGPSTLTHGSGAFGGVVDIINKLGQENKVTIATSRDINNFVNSTQFAHLSLFKYKTALNYTYSSRAREYFDILENTNESQQISLGYSSDDLNLLGKYHRQLKEVHSSTHQPVPLDNNVYFSINTNGNIPYVGDGWNLDLLYRENKFSTPYWDINLNKTYYTQATNSHEQSAHLQKNFIKERSESTLQLESNRQFFYGPSKILLDDVFVGNEKLDLNKSNLAALGITKLNIHTNTPAIELLKVEFGLRYDDNTIEYNNHMEKLYYHSGADTTYRTVIEDSSFTNNYNYLSKQLAFSVKGSVENLFYTFVFSQGNNFRVPTLQDLFYNHTNTVLAYQHLPLKPEIVNSRDLMISFSFIPRNPPLFSSYSMEVDFFSNEFTNKLSYHGTPAQPPLPFNTLTAAISGFELSATLGAIKDPLSISLNTTRLDLSDAKVFPNKSANRTAISIHSQKNNFHLNWTAWSESPHYIPAFEQEFSDPIKNHDVSFSYQKKLLDVNMDAGISFKNILSKDTTSLTERQLYYLPYDETFRTILSLKISFE